MFSRGELKELHSANLGSEIDSSRLKVEHRSTLCGDNAAMPCPKGLAPAVEVLVESRSVIFDFSNVAEPGVFEQVDFAGFVVELLAGSGTPILFASVDSELSNVDLGPEALTHDEQHLDVNFSGVAYDSDSFVKVDLLLGPLNLLGHSR